MAGVFGLHPALTSLHSNALGSSVIMYSLEDLTFIAWGGNRNLALKLSENLTKLGFKNVVGGFADKRQDADEHIANRVITQMRRCSRAIILAQGEKQQDGTFAFRPNLMFEWGYLLARLSPSSR
jgi:hypothetical protein